MLLFYFSFRNEIVSCSKIPSMNLHPWKDHCGKGHEMPEEPKKSEPEVVSEENTATNEETTASSEETTASSEETEATTEAAAPESDEWAFWEKWGY